MGLFSRSTNKGAPTTPTTPSPAVVPSPTVSKIPASVIASPPPSLMHAMPDPHDAVAARVAAASSQAQAVSHERQVAFQRMKVRIHQQLVQRLDVQNLRTLP